MAKQKGIVKLKGTIGDLAFYKTKDGYLAREKGGIDKKRIATDPAFQRTRENGAEFGRGGKAGKVMRGALRQLIQIASDGRVTSRLTREMIKVVKSDPVNKRGERLMKEGDINLLLGFDFNTESKLNSTLFVPFEVEIDRAGGSASVMLEQLIPQQDVATPAACTHVRVHAGIAEIDFEKELHKFSKAKSNDLETGLQDVAPINLELLFTANTELDLFFVLGVEFLQEVNGQMYPLKNGAFNALSIVSVSRV